MRRIPFTLGFLVMLVLATGCRSEHEAESKAATSKTPSDKAEHGHERGEKHDAGHAHGAGPHGGTVLDWGGGAFHLEFTVDHDKKQVVVYILGGDEKTPTPIKAASIQLALNDPMTELDLVASPLDGESNGNSSRFVGTHETLGIVKEFSGTLSGQIEGTPYTNDFQETAHSEH